MLTFIDRFFNMLACNSSWTNSEARRAALVATHENKYGKPVSGRGWGDACPALPRRIVDIRRDPDGMNDVAQDQ
jgi:hypothetical protein